MQCAAHPDIETGLSCGKCGKAICVRCLVHTPVGGRCRECTGGKVVLAAHQVPRMLLFRGVGAALGSGAAFGALWGLVLPYGDGFFYVLLGLALGLAVGESTSMSTNRKGGLFLQAAAIGGVLVAYLSRLTIYALVDGLSIIDLVRSDPYGFVVLAVGAVVAVSRLR